VLLGLLAVTISIVSASVLVGYFKLGIVGLCLGIMLGRLILTIGYPLLISRYLETPLWQQLQSMVRPMLVTLLLFVSAISVDRVFPTAAWPGAQSWLGFFFFAGFSAALILALAFFTGLTAQQRSSILLRLRMVYSHADQIETD
jgi:hypothetical protein